MGLKDNRHKNTEEEGRERESEWNKKVSSRDREDRKERFSDVV